MTRYYAITFGFCKVIINGAAIQAVFHTFVAVNQVSSVLTSKVTHDVTMILDPEIFGRSCLNSPHITHIFQNAGQDKLS
jgi:hypothetical protein